MKIRRKKYLFITKYLVSKNVNINILKSTKKLYFKDVEKTQIKMFYIYAFIKQPYYLSFKHKNMFFMPL